MTHDPSKASVETMRELCEAADELSLPAKLDADEQRFVDVRKRYRAECAVAPLRTRAEVDADIVTELRAWRSNAKTGAAYHSSPSPSSIDKFDALCAEPTREPDPPPAPSARLTEAEEQLADDVNDDHDHDVANFPSDGSDSTRWALDEYIRARRAAPAKGDGPSVTPDQIRDAMKRGELDARIVAGDPVMPRETERFQETQRFTCASCKRHFFCKEREFLAHECAVPFFKRALEAAGMWNTTEEQLLKAITEAFHQPDPLMDPRNETDRLRDLLRRVRDAFDAWQESEPGNERADDEMHGAVTAIIREAGEL